MCFLSVLRGEVSAEDEHSCKMFTQGKQVRSGIPRLRSNTCTAVPIRSSKYETGLIPTRFPTRCRPRHIAQTQVSPGVTQKRFEPPLGVLWHLVVGALVVAARTWLHRCHNSAQSISQKIKSCPSHCTWGELCFALSYVQAQAQGG